MIINLDVSTGMETLHEFEGDVKKFLVGTGQQTRPVRPKYPHGRMDKKNKRFALKRLGATHQQFEGELQLFKPNMRKKYGEFASISIPDGKTEIQDHLTNRGRLTATFIGRE